jgi:hypothetical protein
MPVRAILPSFSALTAFTRLGPPHPLLAFLRSAGDRLRPPRPVPHLSAWTRARDEALERRSAGPRQLSLLLSERSGGGLPTIVLGGFVPDSTEQVLMLRGFFLRKGSVYYFNYPRGGFSLELLCAQLDDLVSELGFRHGQRPVIFSASFGGGVVLEWLRRVRAEGRTPGVAGLVFVSPVACVGDILGKADARPSTLLGRALKPCLDAGGRRDAEVMEKSRAIFSRMFEAGAQNKASLRALMSGSELLRLREAVLGAIRSIDVEGAYERVQALRDMHGLPDRGDGNARPLCASPTLVLYAEREGAVIAEGSPTREGFQSAGRGLFPDCECRVVSGGETPVQHASLIFHVFQFLPPIAAFYRRVKTRGLPLAA